MQEKGGRKAFIRPIRGFQHCTGVDELGVFWHARWGFDVQEFSAAGVRTFAIVEGPADAFPVIFVHGLPGGSFVWAPVISALGRARLAIAPDLPGWGQSVSRFDRNRPSLTPDFIRSWLWDVARAQGIERFDLVAHGTGAWVALELLTENPSRIRRLALVSPHAPRKRLLLGMRLAALMRKPENGSREKIQRWVTAEGRLTPEALAQWQTTFEDLSRFSSGRKLPGLREGLFASRLDPYRRALSDYRGATLLMAGRKDECSPDRLDFHADECRMIEGAGHFPMLDQPEETAAVLKEFLGE